MSSERTTGRLLVATPLIGGGIFRRSVVLVLHHDDGGAHGVVLNHPLEAGVADVLPAWDGRPSSPDRLFAGGPVQTDSALGLALLPGIGDGQVGVTRILTGLAVVDLDAPPEIVMGQVGGLRVFAGYAGWGAGQLEGELAEGSWWVADAEPGDPFTAQPEQLWGRVLARQGGILAWAATLPEDPSLN